MYGNNMHNDMHLFIDCANTYICVCTIFSCK